MTTPKPPVKVEVGQIWADKSQWNKGRTCRIVGLDERRALLEVVTEADNAWPGRRSTVSRRSYVLYDDRGVRGYRLVSATRGDTR